MTDGAKQRPLDPRKYPWHRGDVVTLGFQKVGFVLDSTAEYLEVLWRGTDKAERIERARVDAVLRVSHAASVMQGNRQTNVELLNDLLALTRLEMMLKDRQSATKTESERKRVDLLVARVFATDGCDWDRTHKTQLIALALKPSDVGLLFKIQERVHALFCKKRHG